MKTMMNRPIVNHTSPSSPIKISLARFIITVMPPLKWLHYQSALPQNRRVLPGVVCLYGPQNPEKSLLGGKKPDGIMELMDIKVKYRKFSGEHFSSFRMLSAISLPFFWPWRWILRAGSPWIYH
jgi:hypothetical protein